MDNPPAKDPKKASLLSAPRQQRKLPWDNLPGWHEPERLGVVLDETLGDKIGGLAMGVKVYIQDYVDFIGLRCLLGEGTHAQLFTHDDSPKVYEVHAPETDLILSTWPRVYESNWRTACHWTIRLLAGNDIWVDVDAMHWGKRLYELHIPKEYPTPEIAKLYEDFSDLLKIESRAREIGRRRDYPFSQWTDEEFQRHLNWEHPLPKRSPEEIQALQEAAPILHQKIKALKTWEGRKAMGLNP
jgi:hypothetical protein